MKAGRKATQGPRRVLVLRYALTDAEIDAAMKELRPFLKSFRKRYGLSQEAFARRARVPRSDVAMLERRNFEPGLRLFFRISRGFPKPVHRVLEELVRRARRRRHDAYQRKMSGS